mgnify:CR=1 FL=1
MNPSRSAVIIGIMKGFIIKNDKVPISKNSISEIYRL